jgi:hypothetical protein
VNAIAAAVPRARRSGTPSLVSHASFTASG